MSKSEDRAAPAGRGVPLALLAAAWLVPGLGHWLLGKRVRAAVFASVIVACYVTGVLIDGELGVLRAAEPFSWLTTAACVGNGLLYILRILWLNGVGDVFSSTFPFGMSGGGDPMAVGFVYGNTFLYTAGLMNLLVVLDVADVFRGDKE